MSLVNYTAPFLTTPAPPITNYFHQTVPNYQPPLAHQGPYSYPPPQTPFLREDYGAEGNYPPRQPSQAHHQQQGHHVVGAGGGQHLQHPQHLHHFNQQQQQNGQNGQHGVNGPAYAKVDDDGTKTNIHAVIDYDEYDEDDEGERRDDMHVTPIQGPIYIKNGSVPVVPLYSHPVLSNGSFVQIPILWTALSVALGYEVKGRLIQGVPCIKRNQQLSCPTPGNSYPLDRIELFIDENKALMKRMYGEFDMEPPDLEPEEPGRRYKRANKPGVPDLHFDPTSNKPKNGPESFFNNKPRSSRQNFINNQSTDSNNKGRVDACESKVEIVTPYWASNSAGKLRAIVNTQHFEQAIHQEVCAKTLTSRCSGDCGCEQKYKWHRLLSYDPDNDCKGIFMDWFLFPSCCVCRCAPN